MTNTPTNQDTADWSRFIELAAQNTEQIERDLSPPSERDIFADWTENDHNPHTPETANN